MPWGLLFFGFLAVLVCVRGQNANIPFSRGVLLCLLLGAIALSYIDIPVKSGLAAGGICLPLFCIAGGITGYRRHCLRWAGCGIIIGLLLFVIDSGIFWQLEQFIPAGLPLSLMLSVVVAALAGGYGEALLTAGIGSGSAALAKLILLEGEPGVVTLDICGKISAGAWVLLWLAGYFRRRRLTNGR